MQPDDSSTIEEYLERFKSGQGSLDAEAISNFIKANPECHDRVAEFFRLIDPGESEYLQETLDELTENIYNLAKALVKEVPEEKRSDHENIRFLEEPEESEHYLDEGDEIVADVQDFAGEDQVRGASMDELRDTMQRSKREFDLVQELLQKAIDLDGRHSADCHNLKGILYLSRDRFDEAEECFMAVIRLKEVDLYRRTVQVHAMNNLSYVACARKDLDQAVIWATKSCVLAEETNVDTFSSRFGLMYFYLARGGPDDQTRATEEIERMLADGRQDELRRCLAIPTNSEIRDLVLESGLATRFALS